MGAHSLFVGWELVDKFVEDGEGSALGGIGKKVAFCNGSVVKGGWETRNGCKGHVGGERWRKMQTRHN